MKKLIYIALILSLFFGCANQGAGKSEVLLKNNAICFRSIENFKRFMQLLGTKDKVATDRFMESLMSTDGYVVLPSGVVVVVEHVSENGIAKIHKKGDPEQYYTLYKAIIE